MSSRLTRVQVWVDGLQRGSRLVRHDGVPVVDHVLVGGSRRSGIAPLLFKGAKVQRGTSSMVFVPACPIDPVRPPRDSNTLLQHSPLNSICPSLGRGRFLGNDR
ncbi:MAG: hypothetical protein ABI360_10085 [Allobranchiibius sp.]